MAKKIFVKIREAESEEPRPILITPEMVELLPEDEKDKEFIAMESRTFLQDAWRKFKRNKLAVAGMIFLIFFILLAIFGPMVSKFSYDSIDLKNVSKPPMTGGHILGTDKLGRDVLIRVLYGGRISLTVGVASMLINLLIGTVYGGISGYAGGKIDNIMMRIVDVVYAIPTLLYVLLITMVFGSSLGTVVIAIAVASWAPMARIVRAQVLSLKQQEFTLAARALGAKSRRILFQHLLLNAVGPIIVTAMLQIPAAIFSEAFLSFIGCGIAIPKASWGTLASEALRYVFNYPYQLYAPVIAICLTMFSLNFIGDGLDDAFDPRRK